MYNPILYHLSSKKHFREQSDFPQQVVCVIYQIKDVSGKWNNCCTGPIRTCSLPMATT